jgi:hypothetical protein
VAAYEFAALELPLPFPGAIVALLVAVVVVLPPTCFDIARLGGGADVAGHVGILAKAAVHSSHAPAVQLDDPLQQVLTEDEVADGPYFPGVFVVKSGLEG